jgi:hypothetical protein
MTDETQGTASPPAEGTTTAPVTEEVTQQTTETQTETPEGEPAAQASETEGEATERKRLSGAQKAKRRETFLLNQLAERERELQDIRQASRQTESQQTDADKPPKEEDFNGDWTAYVAARAAFEAGKAVESKLTARETRANEARRSEAERERDLAHLERVEEAREVITDYDKVMGGMKGVNVSNDLIREIKSSENGALIAYELARNPDRLHSMNQMTPLELAREMGRLEASVKKPTGKKQTGAPPPPTILKGGAAPAIDLGKADMDAYVAARKAQGFGAEKN